MVILLLMGAQLFVIGGIADAQILRWAFPALAAASLIAAFATWARFGHDVRWRVERSTSVTEIPA